MDVHCIEMLLDLPEFRLIGLTLGDHQIDLHLQRQEHAIVCPRCQRVCERIKESRSRCIRDLPILERPVMLWLHMRRFQCKPCQLRPWEVSETFDERVKWTDRLYRQVRAESLQGCPSSQLARRYGISERTVFRDEDVSHVLALSEGLSKLIPIDEEPNHQIMHLFRLGKANRAAH